MNLKDFRDWNAIGIVGFFIVRISNKFFKQYLWAENGAEIGGFGKKNNKGVECGGGNLLFFQHLQRWAWQLEKLVESWILGKSEKYSDNKKTICQPIFVETDCFRACIQKTSVIQC